MSSLPIYMPGAPSDQVYAPDSTFRWATVTQVSPLRIRLDGDTTELPLTPDNLSEGSLAVGVRVWAHLFGRRVIILGSIGGGQPPYVVVSFSGTTDASGLLTVTHGLGFTPSWVLAQNATPGSTYAIAWGTDSYTATTFRVRYFHALGTGLYASGSTGAQKAMCFR